MEQRPAFKLVSAVIQAVNMKPRMVFLNSIGKNDRIQKQCKGGHQQQQSSLRQNRPANPPFIQWGIMGRFKLDDGDEMHNPKRSIRVLINKKVKSSFPLSAFMLRMDKYNHISLCCPPRGRPSSSLLNGAKECYEKILKAFVNARPCQLFINHAMWRGAGHVYVTDGSWLKWGI